MKISTCPGLTKISPAFAFDKSTFELPFEDTTVALVRNYDSFLRPEYGDYMQLPPENQRHNHYAALIDFGEE